MRRPVPRSQSCITLIRERSPRRVNEIALSRELVIVDSAKILLEIIVLKMPKVVFGDISIHVADSMLLEFSNIVKAGISKLTIAWVFLLQSKWVKWGVKNIIENIKEN